ncbi:hypothetical protein [Methylobacter sp.]|uniref:hypothetical protein n=1 Tax=Methylobacter sp. TaxID=2051955 RepID=UPI003DA281F8
MSANKTTLAQLKNRFQQSFEGLEGKEQIADPNSFAPKMTREELLADMNRDLTILVQQIWGETKVSQRGNRYSVVHCTYLPIGATESKTYQAAVFSPAGKLIVENLWEGEKYRIKTVLSDRGYYEWSSAEELIE